MLADKLRAATAAMALPTFVSSSSNRTAGSTTTVVTAPSGIQDGDLLVAVSCVGTIAAITPPSGFNAIYRVPATNPGFVLATKIASSESGDYTFTSSVSNDVTAAILVYRNASRLNTHGSWNIVTSTTTSTAQSITPTFSGTLVGVFHHSAASAISTAPSGMTQRVAQFGGPSIAAYDLSNQSASSTGDKTLVWNATSTASGILLQITNEPTVAPEFVASASTQNTSSGATLVINKPAGTVEGDLMVAVMAASGAATSWNDTTFTEVADQGNTSPMLRVAYKVAGASEPSSYSFTAAASTRILSGCILTYRYATYDTVGAFVTGSDPLTLPSVTPTASQSILIACGAHQNASSTIGTPVGMTARFTDNDATAPSLGVRDQVVPSGPTGTRSMVSNGTSGVAGILLSIKPTRSLS